MPVHSAESSDKISLFYQEIDYTAPVRRCATGRLHLPYFRLCMPTKREFGGVQVGLPHLHTPIFSSQWGKTAQMRLP